MVTARKIRAPITVPAIAPTGVPEGVDVEEADTDGFEVWDGEEVEDGPIVEEGEFLLIQEVSSEETTV